MSGDRRALNAPRTHWQLLVKVFGADEADPLLVDVEIAFGGSMR